MCGCGDIAKEFKVNKAGPNQGRLFYACAKPQQDNERCKFFFWADDGGSSEQSGGYGGQGEYGGGARAAPRANDAARRWDSNSSRPAGGSGQGGGNDVCYHCNQVRTGKKSYIYN